MSTKNAFPQIFISCLNVSWTFFYPFSVGWRERFFSDFASSLPRSPLAEALKVLWSKFLKPTWIQVINIRELNVLSGVVFLLQKERDVHRAKNGLQNSSFTSLLSIRWNFSETRAFFMICFCVGRINGACDVHAITFAARDWFCPNSRGYLENGFDLKITRRRLAWEELTLCEVFLFAWSSLVNINWSDFVKSSAVWSGVKSLTPLRNTRYLLALTLNSQYLIVNSPL